WARLPAQLVRGRPPRRARPPVGSSGPVLVSLDAFGVSLGAFGVSLGAIAFGSRRPQWLGVALLELFSCRFGAHPPKLAQGRAHCRGNSEPEPEQGQPGLGLESAIEPLP